MATSRRGKPHKLDLTLSRLTVERDMTSVVLSACRPDGERVEVVIREFNDDLRVTKTQTVGTVAALLVADFNNALRALEACLAGEAVAA